MCVRAACSDPVGVNPTLRHIPPALSEASVAATPPESRNRKSVKARGDRKHADKNSIAMSTGKRQRAGARDSHRHTRVNDTIVARRRRSKM